MELNAGTIVSSKYRLGQRLGSGAFGDVWRAVDVASGAPVALKFLKLRENWAQRRFEREASALGRMNHPGCVALVDYGRTESGAWFIATELLEGETLSSWLKRPHSLSDQVRVATELAEALEYAHRMGVTHRDVKPDNIFVLSQDNERMSKILDFGLASLVGAPVHDVTKTGEILGTAGYMSPEQIRGQPNLGPKCDVYALGAVMFELFEGHAAFDGASAMEVIMAQLRRPVPEVLEHPPRWLGELVVQCMQGNPAQRPAMSEVRRLLQSSGAARDLVVASEARFSRVKFVTGLGAAVFTVVALALVLAPDSAPEPAEVSRYRSLPGNLLRSELPAVPDQGDLDLGTDFRADLGADLGAADDVVADLASAPPRIEFLRRPEHSRRYADPGFRVRFPSGYIGPNAPVVVVYHDYYQTPESWLQTESLVEYLDTHGMILMIADDSRIFGDPAWVHAETTRQTFADLEYAEEKYGFQADGVYVIGHGVGGFAAEIAACDWPRVVAVAMTSHRRWKRNNVCGNPTGVPTLLISGLDDETSPRNGGRDCLSIQKWSLASHEKFALEAASCGRRRPKVVFTSESGTCVKHDCKGDVTWCEVKGGRDWSDMPERPPISKGICQVERLDFAVMDAIGEHFAASRPK